MVIEVYQHGSLVNQVKVDIPFTGFYEQGHKARKLMVEHAIKKIRKTYSYAQLYLLFESKMNSEKLIT